MDVAKIQEKYLFNDKMIDNTIDKALSRVI